MAMRTGTHPGSGPGQAFARNALPNFRRRRRSIRSGFRASPQSHPGTWLFTGIDLDRDLGGETSLAVRHAQTVLDRLVDAHLDQDGETVGRVRMVLAAGGNR